MGTDLTRLGAQIRRLRMKAELSQDELAEAIDVSQAAVSTWENGTRLPSLKTLKRIADACKVELKDVLKDVA